MLDNMGRQIGFHHCATRRVAIQFASDRNNATTPPLPEAVGWRGRTGFAEAPDTRLDCTHVLDHTADIVAASLKQAMVMN